MIRPAIRSAEILLDKISRNADDTYSIQQAQASFMASAGKRRGLPFIYIEALSL